MPDDLPLEHAWPGLMRLAQDGDQRAYRLVLRAMVPAIRIRVRRRIFDETLAEDVVQDVLIAVHRLRHTYDPALPLLPWISAIASARAIDALRRQGRSRSREVNDEDAMGNVADARASAAFEKMDDEADLAGMLGVLPERQREMVEMVKLREMSLDAAAQESRLSVSAVKSLLHRAFLKLREHGLKQREHGKQTHG